MKFLILLYSAILSAHAAHAADTIVVRPIDAAQVGARMSKTAGELFSTCLFSGLPQLANVGIKADSGTALEEIKATLSRAGLKISDFEILISPPTARELMDSGDKVYLLSNKVVCDFSNAYIKNGDKDNAWDHLVCYQRPAVEGSIKLQSMTPERYDRGASDVFDILVKLAPIQVTANQKIVSIGPVICSDSYSCAAAKSASDPLIKLNKALAFDLSSKLIYEAHVRSNITPDENFVLFGAESVECSQKIDANTWKDTTCVVKWTAATTSADRASALQ